MLLFFSWMVTDREAGLLLAFDLYRPGYSAPAVSGTLLDDPTFLKVCAGLVIVRAACSSTMQHAYSFRQAFELLNLNAHLVLRSLRPAGTTKRGIPYGFGFGLVSCPNYLFETLAWTTITVMTGGSLACTNQDLGLRSEFLTFLQRFCL